MWNKPLVSEPSNYNKKKSPQSIYVPTNVSRSVLVNKSTGSVILQETVIKVVNVNH